MHSATAAGASVAVEEAAVAAAAARPSERGEEKIDRIKKCLADADV